MKSIYFKGSIMLSIVALSFTACKKDKQVDEAVVSTSIAENAQADETFSDSFTDISSYAAENDATFSITMMQPNSSGINVLATDEGPDVTVIRATAEAEWPKIITFNYGTGKTKNGITKKGKIIAVFSNRFKIKSSIIYVTYEDFYVNDHRIEGTKKITNNGNPTGNYTFTVEVSKSKITGSKGSFTYDATHTIEWTKGFGTTIRLDDEFSITGSSTGTNSKGITYTTTITKPLIKKVSYPFIVSGKIQITAGDLERILDYGDGKEDSKATYTYIGGPVIEIFLRK